MIFLNRNPYKDAIQQVRFSEEFEKRSVERMIETANRKQSNPRNKNFVYQHIGVFACATIAVVTISIFGMFYMKTYLPSNGDSRNQTMSQNQSIVQTRLVVNANDYVNGSSSYDMPKQGAVIYSKAILAALEDPQNDSSFYRVQIFITPPEAYANMIGEYVFNGRTRDEWFDLSQLIDLSYSEYLLFAKENGWTITEEEYLQQRDEAIVLNATENYKAAEEKFASDIMPIVDSAHIEYTNSESERLINLGYEITVAYPLLIGELTKVQVLAFPINTECGYIIEFENEEEE